MQNNEELIPEESNHQSQEANVTLPEELGADHHDAFLSEEDIADLSKKQLSDKLSEYLAHEDVYAVYEKVRNKMILTGRKENLRPDLEKRLRFLGVQYPN